LETAYSDMHLKSRINQNQRQEQIHLHEQEREYEQERDIGKERNDRLYKNYKKSTSASTLPRYNGKNKIREMDRNRKRNDLTDNLQFRSMENSKIENDLRDFYGSDNDYRNSIKSSKSLSNNLNNSTYNNTSSGTNQLNNSYNSNSSNYRSDNNRSRNNPLSVMRMSESEGESQLLELDHEIGTSHL
jgi:hypothetical protein